MAIFASDLYEPVSAQVTADSSGCGADNNTWPTADGGLLAGALDFIDAEVIAAVVPIGEMGGGFARRPLPVDGYGFGILPPIEGAAVGVVTDVGDGVGEIPRCIGAADGTVGVAGSSRAQLAVLRAAAAGDRGEVGAAIATVKGLAGMGRGAAAVHGTGSGMIVKFNAAAYGQHDDEEAAIMTLLLAA